MRTWRCNSHKTIFYYVYHIRPSARRGLKVISSRHLRSKRRCSCVLQFTRLHAVSCVLHRPTSRVIHHSRLIFIQFFFIVFQHSRFDLIAHVIPSRHQYIIHKFWLYYNLRLQHIGCKLIHLGNGTLTQLEKTNKQIKCHCRFQVELL